MKRIHFREPVSHTCPDVDSVISAINAALRYSEALPIDIISDIVNELEDLEPTLEKLRKANDELRTWGSDESYETDRLEQENADLKRDLESAQDEIKSLKEEAINNL